MNPGCGRLAPATWAYVALPALLLAFAWCRWYVALPLSVLTGAACALYVRRGWCEGMLTRVEGRALLGWVAGILLVSAFTLLSGWGGFVGQTSDHVYRNALFSELIGSPWPVYLPDGRTLCYNFTYWLPAALAGKWAGEEVARWLLVLWGGLGLFLAAAHLRRFSGAGWWLVAFGLYCFGPLEGLQRLIMTAAGDPEYNFWNLGYVGLPELFASQANSLLPTMLVTLLMLRGCVSPGSLGLLLSCALIANPLGMNAILPLGLLALVEKIRQGANWRELVSPANGAGLLLAFIAVALLRVNAVAGEGVQLRLFYTTWPEWMTTATGFLVFLALLRRCDRQSPWPWAAATLALSLPFAAVWGGPGINDWCMKGGMALMTVILAWALRACRGGRARMFAAAALLLLCVRPGVIPALQARNLLQAGARAAQKLAIPLPERVDRLIWEKRHLRFDWQGTVYHPESPFYGNFTGEPDALFRAVFRGKKAASQATTARQNLPCADGPSATPRKE